MSELVKEELVEMLKIWRAETKMELRILERKKAYCEKQLQHCIKKIADTTQGIEGEGI